MKNKELGYDLELDKVIKRIRTSKARLVLLQFADGLKPHAIDIIDYLEENTDAEFLIWLGTCFGACDIPVGLENIEPNVDLVIQFGHNSLQPPY